MTSGCTASHKETDCRVMYSLGLKFLYPKWCPTCKAKFKELEKEFSRGR